MQLLIRKGFASIEGLTLFTPAQPPAMNVRIHDDPGIVVGKSLNATRDTICGVELSKYNLNYTFQRRQPQVSRDETREVKDIAEGRTMDANKNEMYLDLASLPSKLQLPVDPVWITDQGSFGAVTANALAYALRVVRRTYGFRDFIPSRMFIYHFGRKAEGRCADRDTGMAIESGCIALRDHSVCSEDIWSYSEQHLSLNPSPYALAAAKNHEAIDFRPVLQSEVTIKNLLLRGSPIVFGFTVFSSFMTSQVAVTGRVPVPTYSQEEQNGGHVGVLIGYDDGLMEGGAFLFANSFSNRWGMKGLGWIPYAYVLHTEYARDFYTLCMKT